MKILHAALLCAFIAIPVNAAPAPDESKTPAPQIVAQAQSIDQLMGKVKTALKSFVSEKEFAHFEKETLSSFDSKKLAGDRSEASLWLLCHARCRTTSRKFRKVQCGADDSDSE